MAARLAAIVLALHSLPAMAHAQAGVSPAPSGAGAGAALQEAVACTQICESGRVGALIDPQHKLRYQQCVRDKQCTLALTPSADRLFVIPGLKPKSPLPVAREPNRF